MSFPSLEVGYTAAMSRKEDHEVRKDVWWGHWTTKNHNISCRALDIIVPILLLRRRDSSVGIVTCYGLDGLGIESRLGRDFPPWGWVADITLPPLYPGKDPVPFV